MKEFKHFPKDVTCPLCGTNKDSPCTLVQIDGTSNGNIAEAIPIHIECISLRYNKELNLFYQRGLEKEK